MSRESGGEGRIRTCEGRARRFTVFPRWPLGYLSAQPEPTSVDVDLYAQNKKSTRETYRFFALNRSNLSSELLFDPKSLADFSEEKWSWLWDSNPQPADYKSAALPIELNQQENKKTKKLEQEKERTDHLEELEEPSQRLSVGSRKWCREVEQG